jgi:hypothetical protein
MTRPGPPISALLRNVVRRPNIVGGIGTALGLSEFTAANTLRKPLMGFFGEATQYEHARGGAPLILPEHSTQYPMVQYQSPGTADTPSYRSRPRSTGYEYRPFSEPMRDPDTLEDYR